MVGTMAKKPAMSCNFTKYMHKNTIDNNILLGDAHWWPLAFEESPRLYYSTSYELGFIDGLVGTYSEPNSLSNGTNPCGM